MAVHKQIIGYLIGKTISITDSSESWYRGKEFKVVDETKHMITIIHQNIEKQLIKNTITFRILQNETNT